MAYDAGEAFLRIIPSFEGVVTAITAEATKWGAAAGKAFNDELARQTKNAQLGPTDADAAKQGAARAAKFADAFKARVEAALKNLPDITVDANTSEADAKIAELRQRLTDLRDARVGVDIDEATALAAIADIKAQLDQLAADSPDVTVRANSAAASAELDRLKAQIDEIRSSNPDVDVKADTSEADAKLAATKAAADDLGRSSPSINVDVDAGPALAAIGVIKTALLGLSAGALITPLVGGLAALLGPIAAVGAGLGGIAAVGIPAIGAVTKAEKAETAASTAGGQSAAAAALQKISAANAVKSAQEALAGAQKTAADDAVSSAQKIATAEQGVKTAEQAVITAQKAAADAQIALTNAREAATRSLQDSAFSVQDATLALQADQLAVTEAQQNLAAVNANSASTDLQKQEAALQLAQAQQALAEQTVTLQRATVDNTAAQKSGVDGSKQVIAAQTAVTVANKQIVTSQQGVVTATAAVAAAKKAAADQAAAEAQKIGDAQRALAQAELSQAASAQSAAGGTNSYAKALAALTPAERELKSALDELKEKFTDFQTALDPSVIPLFTGALGILGDLMKPLEPLIVAVATAIGKVETSIDNAIKSPSFGKFIGTLTNLAGPSVASIADILSNLGGAISGLITAFAPLSGVVFGGLSTLTRGLKDATTGPGITGFVKTLEGLAPTLVSAFQSIGGLVGEAFKTLAPLAEPVLQVVKTLADTLTEAFKKSGPDLTKLFTGLATIADKLITALAPALPVIVAVLADIATFVAKLSPNGLIAIAAGIGAITFALGGPFTAAAVAVAAAAVLIIDNWSNIKPAIQPVLDVFNDIWGFITQQLVPVLEGIFTDALAGIRSAFETVGNAIEGHKAQLLELQHAFNDIVGFIVRDVVPIVGPILKGMFELIGLNIRATIDVIAGLVEAFNGVVSVGRSVGAFFSGPFVNFFTTAWHDIKGAYTDVRDFFVNDWTAFAGTAKKLWDNIAGGISKAFGAVTGAVKGVWHDIETAFVGSVNWVVGHVINPVIHILNDVTGIFKIPKIGDVATISTSVQSANAGGGVLPGYTPGTDGMSLPVHLFSGGEGILVPEATRALGGKTGIDAINAHYSNRISQKFSKGGTTDVGNTLPRTAYEQTLLDAQAARDAAGEGNVSFVGQGGIGSTLSGIGNTAANVVAAIRTGVADAAIAALKVAEAPVRAVIGAAPGDLTKNLANGIFDKINDAAFNFIKGNVTPTSPTTVQGTSSLSAEHQLFIETALAASGVSRDPFNIAGVNTIVEHESGWNPNAINLTDSNAKAGHPSQGLMQTIPSTFEAHRLSSLPDVITDALANLVAGIRYAVGRYGSINDVPGVRAVRDGGKYVGYDNGGLLPPGISSVYNGTGKPEPVFTNGQWAQMGLGGAAGNEHLASMDRKLDRLEELVGIRQLGAAAEYAAGTANAAIGILEGVGR